MQYSASESYFHYPILVPSGIVQIRKDSNGKGNFGANRDGHRKHQGVDLTVPAHMPVFASKSGRVLFAGLEKGYGNYIELLHPDGRATRYAHLTERCVQAGDWVTLGSVIGTSGRTGNAAGRKIRPHVHFEIRALGIPVDPGAGLMDPSVRMK